MPLDPRSVGPRPPFPRPAGATANDTASLDPRPDHGERSYRGTGRLADCAALVTGGDSGIGRAIAIAFAREGADVLIAYHRQQRDAEETAEWVRRAGRRAVLAGGDIGDPQHCEAIVTSSLREFGRLDVLVNNAAFQRSHAALPEWSADEVGETFRTNIESMFHLARVAAPRMRPGSSIINTASIQADDPSPNLLAYASSKGAIVTFTAALAQLLGKDGIRVNAVAPGPVWTPLIPSTMPAEKVENFGGDTPLGRPAQPAELAPAYVFLASDQATYISGAVLPVTGGRPML